jgi:hypothetical protein
MAHFPPTAVAQLLGISTEQAREPLLSPIIASSSPLLPACPTMMIATHHHQQEAAVVG